MIFGESELGHFCLRFSYPPLQAALHPYIAGGGRHSLNVDVDGSQAVSVGD